MLLLKALKMLLKVSKIVKETHDTYTIRFNHDLEFVSGQFVIIFPEIGGKKIQRSYSIASSPTEKGYFELTIKKIKGGKVSTWATEVLKVGDEIEVRGPYGRTFLLDEISKEVVFIASGSGIVPFRCMMHYIQEKNLPIKVTLLYSNKTPQDIIFKIEFDKMAKKFKIIHTITREKWDGNQGRIDANIIKKEAKDFSGKLFYICGSDGFTKSMFKMLLELGVERNKIRREGFGG